MLSQEKGQHIFIKIQSVYFPPWNKIDPVLYTLVKDFYVSTEIIANVLEIQRPNVSRWLNGKAAIPVPHRYKLHDLLGEVITVAKRAVKAGEMFGQFEHEKPSLSVDMGFINNSETRANQIEHLNTIIGRAEGLFTLYTPEY